MFASKTGIHTIVGLTAIQSNNGFSTVGFFYISFLSANIVPIFHRGRSVHQLYSVVDSVAGAREISKNSKIICSLKLGSR